MAVGCDNCVLVGQQMCVCWSHRDPASAGLGASGTCRTASVSDMSDCLCFASRPRFVPRGPDQSAHFGCIDSVSVSTAPTQTRLSYDYLLLRSYCTWYLVVGIYCTTVPILRLITVRRVVCS